MGMLGSPEAQAEIKKKPIDNQIKKEHRES